MHMQACNDVLLLTTGITLRIDLEASEALKHSGVDATVLHMHTVKPLDVDAILLHAAKAHAIVTIEEHTILGGLGGAVAEVLAEAGFNPAKRFKRIGLPDVFPHGDGSQASMMEHYGITTEKTIAAVNDLLLRTHGTTA